MNWYIEALRKYAIFSGRAQRQEYWFFVLINTLMVCMFAASDYVLGLSGILCVTTVYNILVFIPGYAVLVRRLHDIGCSAWWLVLYLPSYTLFLIAVIFGAMSAAETTGLSVYDQPSVVATEVVSTDNYSWSDILSSLHSSSKKISAKKTGLDELDDNNQAEESFSFKKSFISVDWDDLDDDGLAVIIIIVLVLLLVCMVPVFSQGVIFAFTILDSQKGDNQYGQNPKLID